MTMQMNIRLIFVTASIIAFTPGVLSAQGASILRPTQISQNAHELTVEPSLAGFQVGESFDTALARLAGPVRTSTLASDTDSPISVTNADASISLFGGLGGTVGIIMVSNRESGALDGIRVGDSRKSVVERWGVPAAGGDKQGLWLAREYIITVQFNPDGYVSRLGIGFGQ